MQDPAHQPRTLCRCSSWRQGFRIGLLVAGSPPSLRYGGGGLQAPAGYGASIAAEPANERGFIMERTKKNARAFVVGMILGGVAFVVLSTLPGCGTVSGIGHDLMRASDGIRNAMTQDE